MAARLLGFEFRCRFRLSCRVVVHGLLAAAGYDPEALVRYLERLESPQQSGKLASLKSTHPPASDRAKAARRVLRDANLATQPSARFEQLFAAALQ